MPRRRRRVFRAVPVTLALGLSGVSVWVTSNQAFSDEPDPATSSNASSATDGPLTGLRPGETTASALRTANLAPGSTGERCTVVTMAAAEATADAAPVRLYVADGYSTRQLASYLRLQIDIGTGGSPESCAGFVGTALFDGTLAETARDHQNYATGVSGWLPGQRTVTYRVRYTFAADAPNSVSGGTAGATFVWERQPVS